MDIASRTTAPPHSSRLGNTRASGRGNAFGTCCLRQPAGEMDRTDRLAGGARDAQIGGEGFEADTLVAVAQNPEAHLRLLARARKGLEQQVDGFPIDQGGP